MFIFRYRTFKLHSSHARKNKNQNPKKMRLKFPRISQFVIISKAVQSEEKSSKNETESHCSGSKQSKGRMQIGTNKKEDFTKLALKVGRQQYGFKRKMW